MYKFVCLRLNKIKKRKDKKDLDNFELKERKPPCIITID